MMHYYFRKTIGVLLCSLLFNLLQAQQPELVTPVPHTSFVTNTRFSNNGALVATASEDHTAKVWNAFTGQLLFTALHADDVEDVAFSKDDQLLLTVSRDSTACIWSLRERKLLHRLKGHTNRLVSGAFSNDGTMVITGARENHCILWSVATGAMIKRIKVFDYDDFIEGTGAVYAVSFSKDGSKFLTGSFDGQCRLWNTSTGKLIRSFVAEGSYIKVAKFSNDEKYIVAAEWSGFDAYVWQTATGKLVRKFHSASSFEEYAVLSTDNSRVLTALNDTTAALYDVKSGKLISSFSHSKKIYDATLTKDNRYVITGSWDETVKLWDASTGDLLQNFTDHKGMIMKLAVSPDPRYFVSVSTDMTGKIWDIENRRLFRDLNYPNYIRKEGSFYIAKDKLAINFGNHFNLLEANNLELHPQEQFDWLDWAIKNKNGKYIARQSNINYRSPLVVFDDALQKLFTLPDYKYPHLFSNTGKYLFSYDTLDHGIMYSLPAGKRIDTLFFPDDYGPRELAFSANDEYFVAAENENRIRVWNMNSGKLLYTIEDDCRANDLLITKDNRFIVAACGSNLRYYHLENGLLEKEINVGVRIYDLAFTTNEQYVVVISDDKKARSYAFLADSAEQLVDHAPYENGKSSILLSGTTTDMVFSSITSNAVIWNVHTGLLNDNGTIAKGDKFMYQPARNLAAFCGPTTVIWDLSQQKIKTRIHVTDDVYETVRDAQFIPIGTRLIIITYGRISLFDVDSGDLLYRFPEINNQVLGCSFREDGKELLVSTAGFDYVYEFPGMKLRYTVLTQNNNNYLMRTGDGYYTGSRDIVKQLHYITQGLHTLGFQQLDIVYNRPDKVLEAVGNNDTALMQGYKRAYLKRLKKLGIDSTQLSGNTSSVPVADIQHRSAIKYEQRNSNIKLTVSAKSEGASLKQFNIWINEVPLYGSKGLSIASSRRTRFDTTVVVALSEGENRIEVSVTDVSGIESYRQPLMVKYIPVRPSPKRTYFVGIGINRFADTAYNLNWSVKDIRDLARKVQSKYPDMQIDTLFDRSVTRENILQLKKKLAAMDINDRVIVSYSGHGVLSKQLDYYLSTYDINFNKPEEKGLAYEELESLLDNIKPRQKVMFIDACHSGEVDKEDIQRIEAVTKALDSLGTTTDAANRSRIIVKKSRLGMANSFELMQNIFVNVSRGTGATIISAAGGMQYAQERGDLQNGVFTYSIIDAFNKNTTLTVSRLKQIVGESVLRLTMGLQKPTSRTESSNFDWVIW